MDDFEKIAVTIPKTLATGQLPQVDPATPKKVRDVQPTILIDSREQRPLRFEKYPVEIAGLPVGDYSIKGFHDWMNPGFTIERKSLDDLCGSLGNDRDRFMREIEKMRQFRFRGLVIEALEDQVRMKQYRSQIEPSSVFGTLDALIVRTGLHIFWCGDPVGAAAQVENLAEKFIGGITKDYERLLKGEQS